MLASDGSAWNLRFAAFFCTIGAVLIMNLSLSSWVYGDRKTNENDRKFQIFDGLDLLAQPALEVGAARNLILSTISSSAYFFQRPNRGVAFVKTHKTGSSTLTSILHAIGTAHNLSVPVTSHHYFDPLKPWSRRLMLKARTTVLGKRGPPVDIWCNHIKFHPILLTTVVPTSNGKVLSIIRAPADRMRSSCAFFGCCPHSGSNVSVWNEFVSSPEGSDFFRTTTGECSLNRCSQLIVGSGIDLGSSFEQSFEQVEKKIRSEEWLLLVMERFDESMLVFANEYNLHLLDVTYFTMKESGVENFEAIKEKDTLAAESRMTKWNSFDSKLYELANEMLDKKLERLFGPSVAWAQKRFQTINLAVNAACDDDARFAPGLRDWCIEKRLDNVEWNEKHRIELIRLEAVAATQEGMSGGPERRTIPTDHRAAGVAFSET